MPGAGDITGYAAGALIFIYSKASAELQAFRITKKGRGFSQKKVIIVGDSEEEVIRKIRDSH